MDYENDHLNYPNLVSAHIKTCNASISSSTGTSSLPPPPSPIGGILQRIENSAAMRRPPLEPYKFEVEKEVLARAEKRDKQRKMGESVDVTPSPSQEPIELDLSGGVVNP